jgi:flavin-dependent dehydrogenase
MKGCWVEVGDEGKSLRVKVEGDVIVFPADSKGRIIAAQGVVEAVEMSREAYIDWLAHLAEEKGEPFDAAAAKLGDGPHRTIRIRGTGAQLE